MEETVGKFWHKVITRRAEDSYPHACVELSNVSSSIALFFRALGGDGVLKIDAATPREHGARRHWLQRVAGSHRKAALAWRDHETLRLPAQLSLYPTRQLNRDLYFWLAALAAVDDGRQNDWFVANQKYTLGVLHRYPGLRPRYDRLVAAELQRRIPLAHLSREDAEVEQTIRAALALSGFSQALPEAKRPPQPVWLWLYAAPNSTAGYVAHSADNDEDEETAAGEVQESHQQHRYQAEQVDMPDGEDGLITMRWENILSWAEYIKVDRTTDDDEDKDAARKAADMDVLSVARDQKASASRLRLDLDLPSAEYDDIPLKGEVTLPEWDWRKQKMLPDHCVIRPMLPRDAPPKPLPDHLRRIARRLRGQFESLAQNRIWLRHQKEGVELDMNAWLDNFIARQTSQAIEEQALYRELRQNQRDIATLMLADLSLSTDAAVNNEQRVIDVIRETLLLFCEALTACGDQYALYGFSSKKRAQVRFYQLKNFTDKYNDQVRGYIQAIRPGYYTRMGAAIRHAGNILGKQAATKRLMLILTDGKPNDLDKYEGRYGVEDTHQAILEAKQQGLTPFCITIDHKADEYLPYLFGRNGYVMIRRPEQLPQKMLSLYAQLTAGQ